MSLTSYRAAPPRGATPCRLRRPGDPGCHPTKSPDFAGTPAILPHAISDRAGTPDDHPPKSYDVVGTPDATPPSLRLGGAPENHPVRSGIGRGPRDVGRRRGAGGIVVRVELGCREGLAAADSPVPWGTVPWALRGFTAEFGMGSGGAPALGHQAFPTPDPPHAVCDVVGTPEFTPRRLRRRGGFPSGSPRSPRASWGGCWQGSGCSGRGGMVPGLGRGERVRAIRTGWLSRLPCVHLRPIDVVVYHGSRRDLVWRWVSRLDAFSGYPVRTWLPGCAAGATTGPPEVRPPRSSRTEGGSAQVSYTHGR